MTRIWQPALVGLLLLPVTIDVVSPGARYCWSGPAAVTAVGIMYGRVTVTRVSYPMPIVTFGTFEDTPAPCLRVKEARDGRIGTLALLPFGGNRASVMSRSLGFSLARLNDNGMPDIREFQAPHWPMVVAAAVLVGRGITRRRVLRARERNGCCRACGYDLRASPDRCPECGAACGVDNAPPAGSRATA